MRCRGVSRKLGWCVSRVAAGLCLSAGFVLAEDIPLVQPAALDQPRINAYLSLTADGAPQSFEGTFNIEAFFDTGASGVLLSQDTADFLAVPQATFNGQPVIYHDVGVAGSDAFAVSDPVHIGLASYHPDTPIDDPNTYTTVYNQVFHKIRTQIGPVTNTDPNPLLEDLDVFGVPLMQGKVVVFDPKPVNTFADTMRTYVYNPGTPYNASTADSNPGIPTTSRHVALSYADLSRFTSVEPAGATGPTLAANPFIGPNPLNQFDPNSPPDNTPGITVSFRGRQSTGSWLLDTGAAASILSVHQAQNLGVSYRDGTFGTDSPDLVDSSGQSIPDQFTLTIGGIGGTTKVAGFYLDTLLLHTVEGDQANDPSMHFNFVKAPVLVSDITAATPDGSQTLTLDGVFGMNFLVASAHITEGADGELPSIDSLSTGPFDWVVFDQPGHTLGLQLAPPVPAKQDLVWAASSDGLTTWLTADYALFGSTFTDKNQEVRFYRDGDSVTFDDTAEATDVDLFIDVAPESILVNNSIKDYSFTTDPSANAKITGNASLTKTGTATLTIATANDYTGPTEIIQGKVILAAQQNIGDVTVHAAGKLQMQTSQQFGKLRVDGGRASVDTGHDKVLVTRGLELLNGGQLDLGDNDMVVFYSGKTPLATIRQYASSGTLLASAGSDSSVSPFPRTLAVWDNNTTQLSVFDGVSLPDFNEILIKYTYFGDANLDGMVTPLDYAIVDGNVGLGNSWVTGDLNGDGVVNPGDYAQIDGNIGAGTGGNGGPQMLSVAAVPEPASAGLFLMGAGLMALRRRRNR